MTATTRAGRNHITRGLLLVLMGAAFLLPAAAQAPIGIDAKVSLDQNAKNTTIAAPAFSTVAGGELLLAFVSTDYLTGTNTSVQSMNGAGLTWVLVVRANAQSGTSEIWRAFAATPLSGATVTATLSHSVAASITVMSFTGVDPSGSNGSGAVGATKSASAASGAPAATVVTTRDGSWVFGVGNDWDKAVARTPGAGQTVMHQLLSSAGDTYWVQQENSPTALNGTSVTINDTAPTADRYNLSVVEVLPQPGSAGTFSISGTIGGSGGSGATVKLTGTATATITADVSGNYAFNGLANGGYTVTPSNAGYSFAPGSAAVTISNASAASVNFAATALTYNISGTISGAGGIGATVTLTGAANATTTANSSGAFTFSGLANGGYTVTPSNPGSMFSPASLPVTVANASVGNANFTAAPQTYSISGTISGTGGNGATVTLSGDATATVTANSSGVFTLSGLANGAYTVTPSHSGYSFAPASIPVTLAGVNVTSINFAATALTYSISGTIAPAAGGGGATVTLTGTSGATTTADGAGNYSFPSIVSGSYTLTPSNPGYSFTPPSQSVTVAGANATGVNFTAQPGGTIISLAIDSQVSADQAASKTVATAAFSTQSPNELLLAFVATDYLSGANTTVSSIAGAGLTWTLVKRTNVQSGTAEIWRAFAPGVLSNVTVTATLSQKVGSSLTVMSFVGADASGTNGSGAIGATGGGNSNKGAPTASLITTRTGSWVFGVGSDFDNALARTPGTGQNLVHQNLSASGDTYWVQMQGGPTGASGTPVAINDTAPTGDRYNLTIVEVLPASAGAGNPVPPTISMTSPAANTTLANQVTLAATANGQGSALLGVQFLIDGNNAGAEITNAPYSIVWDSSTATAGPHTLSAVAYNAAGLNGTSSPISITVDNSGNPAVVGSWAAPVSLPAVAVNLTLLKTNKVLFYEDGSSPTVWDYVNGVFSSVPTSADLFCSGQTALADGRILVVGGYGGSGTKIGIPNAEIFDPSNNSWTILPKMSYSRWYPTATTLSDGRVLVTAGWQTSEHTNAGIPEIYDPATNTWTKLTTADNPFETYPFIYLLPDGRVIHVGGSEYATVTDILDLNTKTWSVVDANIVDGASPAMYLPGKIMKAGSASDSQNTGPSANTTYVLDTTQANPTWRQTPSMVYPRSYMNSTILPDGTVLASGGETDKNGGDISKAVYAAELWNAQTQTWTTMASMRTPREYHSTAILLPDGRVMQSGMGADFGNVPNEMTAEIYSPPYLFKGARPTIAAAPAQITYGQNFSVSTPDGASIASAVLIRTGSVTHFFDENARFVPVAFESVAGGLTVTAPANANLAPPGYYLLFIVNTNGVPSVAPFVQIH